MSAPSASDNTGTTIDIPAIASGPLVAHAVRLNAKSDLIPSLHNAVQNIFRRTHAGSCFVMTAVGSLSQVTLRLANASRDEDGDKNNDICNWKERFEVVSLVGTFAHDGKFHLHMAIANAKGETFGGHLVAGTVFTTMEIVLGTIGGVTFDRVMDPKTGYRELVVKEESEQEEDRLEKPGQKR